MEITKKSKMETREALKVLQESANQDPLKIVKDKVREQLENHDCYNCGEWAEERHPIAEDEKTAIRPFVCADCWVSICHSNDQEPSDLEHLRKVSKSELETRQDLAEAKRDDFDERIYKEGK